MVYEKAEPASQCWLGIPLLSTGGRFCDDEISGRISNDSAIKIHLILYQFEHPHSFI
jgi:hypothetical protein